MIQDIGDKKFNNQYIGGVKPSCDDYVFIIDNSNRICFRKELAGEDLESMTLPTVKEVTGELVYLFSIDDEKFFLLNEKSEDAPSGYEFHSSRVLRDIKPSYLGLAGATALHLANWYEGSKYCGKCGTLTIHDENERMKRCPKCGNMIFPRINPAVTVAVINGDKLLVCEYAGKGHSRGLALIAGFIEIGETAEECAAREVMEETGLAITDIKYYGSQPWGFSGNLQMGFTAKLFGDDKIKLDERELSNAFFIARNEIQESMTKPSLTQDLIEAFRLGKI